MKLLGRLKKFNYRHYICVAAVLGSLLSGVFFFTPSYVRLLEGFKDFGLSIAYYFTKMLDLDVITPTVTLIPAGSLSGVLPYTWEEFTALFSDYGRILVSEDNLKAYFGGVLSVLGNMMSVLVMVLPFAVMLVVLFRRALKRQNNDYGKDSKPLRLTKKAAGAVYVPVKNWVKSFSVFVREKSAYVKLFVFLWAVNLNLITVVMELLAFLFYFIVSFDLANVYTQAYKLFCDLSVLRVVPVPVWVIVGLIIFEYLRRKTAYAVLRHLELSDRGLINSLPLVTMIVGTMGKNKTTTLTDMVLSQSVMFRDKAFELILQNDLKFPHFPWVCFERQIKKAVTHHEIYNLATCKTFLLKKRRRFIDGEFVDPLFKYTPEQYKLSRDKLYGYHFHKYGLTYDDKLKVVDLFEVLETYAQLYFIYIIESSLLVSNYSIREDCVLSDTGNFPLWDGDFFRRDSRLIDGFSRHAHILDFDTLRLGKKVAEDDFKANALDFGVVVITEVGKERGNQLDNQGKKKDAAETNQKNDGFNQRLKMARHSATVDNYPFIKVFMDEQRPESLGADARELCDIVHIRDKSDARLALPFFYAENLLHDFLFPRFRAIYYDYRYTRADNTLFMHVVKKLIGGFHAYYTRTYNRFSYYALRVDTERGTQDGLCDSHKYYLMPKKIYAKRFATDAFGDYFMHKAMRSAVGLADITEYATERADLSELQKQNSYFINELQEHFKE
jgi:hypothetical protein